MENLENCFLTQFVTEPTFQNEQNKESKNTLDLVIGDCPERISDIIRHFAPLGSMNKTNHVLKWSLN